ncbi:unnamed protein product, partial [Laminaria digitata]
SPTSTRCFCSGADNAYEQYGEADSDDCDMPCSGFPEDTCGSRFRLSVYSITGEGKPAINIVAVSETALKTPIATNFVGCYADVWDPRQPPPGLATRSSSAMTVEKCREFCLVRGQSLFGLENGHE